MESIELRSMSTDELWDLLEKVNSTLADKIEAEKATLNERLRRIGSVSTFGVNRVRRPYPPVRPKYKNPSNPAEVWSGRGKQPLWVKKQLKTGKKLDQFLIVRSAVH
jgi:DNA-binding protein H-NS